MSPDKAADDAQVMGAVGIAVVLSMLAAVGYALGAVVQERVAARDGGGSVLVAPLWWFAMALNGVGAGLHVVALRYGSLDVVQPLGALTLVFALPAGAVLAGRRVTQREWRGAGTTLAGLGLLLVVVDTSAPATALDSTRVFALGAVTALALAVLLGGGDTATLRGPRLAGAGGVAFAVASVLSQTVMLRWADPTADDVATVMIASAVAGLSMAGTMLSQSAYRLGLGVPLATVTIANPVFAGAVGVLLFGQSISTVGAAVAVPAALLAAHGVVLLATPGPVAPRPFVPAYRRAHRHPADRRLVNAARRLRHRAGTAAPGRLARPANGPDRPSQRQPCTHRQRVMPLHRAGSLRPVSSGCRPRPLRSLVQAWHRSTRVIAARTT